MSSLKFYISDELDQKFRKIAMKCYGYGRGSLSAAAEHALLMWVENIEQIVKNEHIPKNPVEVIKGLLKDVKKTSVELQREMSQIRISRLLRE